MRILPQTSFPPPSFGCSRLHLGLFPPVMARTCFDSSEALEWCCFHAFVWPSVLLLEGGAAHWQVEFLLDQVKRTMLVS